MAKKKSADSSALQELKRALREKQLNTLYLFYGPESYLREYYLALAQKQLIQGPAATFNFHRFHAETFSADGLQDAVEAIPMMAQTSMVQIEDVDPYKLAEPEREKLIAVLSDIPEYCHVFFVFDTVEYKPDKRLKKLHGMLDKQATVVCFEKQSERDLADWIHKHFSKAKKEISFDLCRYLILRTGGSMSLLRSEIEKIAAFSKQTDITKENIDAVVEPVLDAYVFDMTDAVAAGRFEKALSTLQTLLQLQSEPIALLGALGAQLRRIYAAQQLQGAGKGADSLMKLCGMGSYPAQKTMEFARRLSSQFCKRALVACMETDYRMKTSYDTPARLLELLLLQLAQETKHG